MPLTFKLVCDCGTTGKCVLTDEVLKAPLDRWAIVLKIMNRREGWHYRGGRLGKSVATAICSKCVRGMRALRLDADFAPDNVVPMTREEDQELWRSTTYIPDGAD